VTQSDFWHALLIFGSTFVLEDIAVLGAALLVANSMVSLPWAAGSSFAGIWIGDLGLYFIALHYGRPVFDRAWFKRLLGKKINLSKSESWFRDHGKAAILLSRAVPGTRLPTYLAAGLLKVPAPTFLSLTALACVVWVALLFWFSYHVGMMVISEFNMFRSEAGKLAACIVVAAALGWALRKLLKNIARFKKYSRWEFWPVALFYIPVCLKYLGLAMRYRSFTLPTAANPGMHTGGFIGESKFDTLDDLSHSFPEFVAETHLVRYSSVQQQLAEIQECRAHYGLDYPLVFKPDVGQRGFAFKLIHSDEEARAYIQLFARDTLIQKYAPGPHEAGIFYYRFPNNKKGKIFAITDKVFPTVTGDGIHDLEYLIRKHPRASFIADTYLKRFSAERTRVLNGGEVFRLVEAGNHCQGSIFLDGARLNTAELEQRIDEISQSITGFFVGRYDVRYASEDRLRQGEDFQIIELNGASSEATSIYDPNNSLASAYRTLFNQWEIIFEIGHQNRERGLQPTPLKQIWKNWTEYRTHVVPSVSD
jgi:membrane protein DedA with SNARE-associated domain